MVELALILQDERVQLVRQREYHVEVARIQEFLFPSLNPAFACLRLALVAMPVTAAVVGDGRISATLKTNIDMTAERRSAAPRDGPDCLELLNTQGVSADEVVASSAEDVGHLNGGPRHCCFFLFLDRFNVSSAGVGNVSSGFATA